MTPSESLWGSTDNSHGRSGSCCALFLPLRPSTVFTLLKRPHAAQGIGTDVPDNARTVRAMETITDRVCARVEQGLAATVAMVLHSITAAAISLGAIIHVTEPRAVLKRQSADPFVLDL